MFIVRAQSLAAARAIAEADPMHASGARQYELRPWLLNHLVVPDEAKHLVRRLFLTGESCM
jgi:uncharacterized protein